VKELFEQALELPDERRRSFLLANEGDEAVRAQVLALLEEHERAGSFLQESPLNKLSAMVPSEVASPAITAGHVLSGRFRIVRFIGRGGMGEVYEAHDTRLRREVAIKVLPQSFAGDAGRLRRFELEARAVASLSHPNILALYDIGVEKGTLYLVVELLEGQTLRDLIGANAVARRKVVDYAKQIARGMAAAHSKGIVHRDLKPANVFVCNDGRVKILDFGLAKPQITQGATFESFVGETCTQPGAVLGTVAYMSPEQVRGQPADYRSDIFSFGTVLYEMSSGETAFRGDSAVETMNAILKQDPAELVQVDHVSPGLGRITHRCLEKKPEERFQSAHDLAFALEALSGASAPKRGTALSVLRGSLRWFALAVAVLIVVSGGIMLGRRVLSPRAIASYQPLSLRPGTVFSGRFAPGGQAVLFSAAFDGDEPDVYIARRESLAPQALSLSPAILLSLSHTDEMAVLVNPHFISHLQWEGTLATAPIGGGAPREVMEQVMDADYAPDGSSMAVIRQISGKIRVEYPIGKSIYETTGWVSCLRVSPDGQRVAFLDHPVRWDTRGSVVMLDQRGKKDVLTDGWSALRSLAWSPHGDEVWFSGVRSFGPAAITYVVTMSHTWHPTLSGPDGLAIADLSSDGRVLATSGSEEYGINFSRNGQPERDLSWMRNTLDPYLSPDGKTMLFHDTSVSFYYTACMRKTDGSPVVQLGSGGNEALSPNGKWALSIVYSIPPQLLLLPIGPGDSQKLERGPIETYEIGDWLPDGKEILFTGNEAGKPLRAYIQSIAGGLPKAITPEGIEVFPRAISPDGQWVIAIDAQKKMVLYPINGGEVRLVPGIEVGESPIRFNADGSALYVARSGQYPVPVYKVDVRTGRRQLWRELNPPERAGITPQRTDRGFIHASADGSVFAYTYVRFRGELYLVSNNP
jgi:hypothetical protein